MIDIGIYKHYKGGYYTVLFMAIDTTDGKDVVVYTDEVNMYTRPASEWFDKIGDTYRFIKVK